MSTPLGQLHQGDCLDFLDTLASGIVDLAFADPPFNLGKEYNVKVNDSRSEQEYLDWCMHWLDGMVRILKPGGFLFLWNLPK